MQQIPRIRNPRVGAPWRAAAKRAAWLAACVFLRISICVRRSIKTTILVVNISQFSFKSRNFLKKTDIFPKTAVDICGRRHGIEKKSQKMLAMRIEGLLRTVTVKTSLSCNCAFFRLRKGGAVAIVALFFACAYWGRALIPPGFKSHIWRKSFCGRFGAGPFIGAPAFADNRNLN